MKKIFTNFRNMNKKQRVIMALSLFFIYCILCLLTKDLIAILYLFVLLASVFKLLVINVFLAWILYYFYLEFRKGITVIRKVWEKFRNNE